MIYSAGDCPVCKNAGELVFVVSLSTGNVFVRCAACDCAWPTPTDRVDSIVATRVFAPQGYRPASRDEIAVVGLTGAIVSERGLR